MDNSDKINTKKIMSKDMNSHKLDNQSVNLGGYAGSIKNMNDGFDEKHIVVPESIFKWNKIITYWRKKSSKIDAHLASYKDYMNNKTIFDYYEYIRNGLRILCFFSVGYYTEMALRRHNLYMRLWCTRKLFVLPIIIGYISSKPMGLISDAFFYQYHGQFLDKLEHDKYMKNLVTECYKDYINGLLNSKAK